MSELVINPLVTTTKKSWSTKNDNSTLKSCACLPPTSHQETPGIMYLILQTILTLKKKIQEIKLDLSEHLYRLLNGFRDVSIHIFVSGVICALCYFQRENCVSFLLLSPSTYSSTQFLHCASQTSNILRRNCKKLSLYLTSL